VKDVAKTIKKEIDGNKECPKAKQKQLGIQVVETKLREDIFREIRFPLDVLLTLKIYINAYRPVAFLKVSRTENKADEIKKFLIRETGMWIGLPGCVEEFDVLVKEFFKASSDSDKKSILGRARTQADAIADEPKKGRATYYVKTLEKIVEKGNDFVDGELKRVEKLADGKVSDNKKAQLKEKASILTSFQMRQKDEL